MIIIGNFAILHRGYLDILDKYPTAQVYILSDSLARSLYQLEADLRKMPVTKMQSLLSGLNRPIKILDENNIYEVVTQDQIVLIDDDVTQELRKKYLNTNPEVIMESGFFYHPLANVYKAEPSNLNLVRNFTDADAQIMKKALLLAAESGCFWRQVASIIIRDDQILYQAYNQMLPNNDECYKIGCIRDNLKPGEKTAELCSAVHSEANCIAQAAKDGVSLKNASIYVTVFPCPMCAKLIALSGIKKCFYNTGWANFDGERVMQAAGVELIKIDV